MLYFSKQTNSPSLELWEVDPQIECGMTSFRLDEFPFKRLQKSSEISHIFILDIGCFSHKVVFDSCDHTWIAAHQDVSLMRIGPYLCVCRGISLARMCFPNSHTSKRSKSLIAQGESLSGRLGEFSCYSPPPREQVASYYLIWGITMGC